ncbi:unnamed protein product [Callosobruchus maculatus]|uniref:Disks large-associated protein 5 n=1 Tax=Callosobruchus maculatus TaxID=64391 RepID=A0A653C8Y6_CALMS|nr:unnamed protein product [Callosobruchus maculatus]
MMDLGEYIKQKTAQQELYKEAVSKEYHRTNVKDRIQQIQNGRRHTRDKILNGIRNITNLSPITPISRDQSTVPKKVAMNNMREKLAKWRVEKEKRKLEEKKKARPVFKVSHVPDKIELPPPPPNFKSKFAPVDHVFAPPKNIKPIDITKTSNSLNKPVKRLPNRAEKNVRSNNQKSEIKGFLNGKENKAKVIPSKNLQAADEKKTTSVKKNELVASSSGVLRVIPSKDLQTTNQKKAKSNQKNVATASNSGDSRVPSEDEAINQKSKITKTVKGKENTAKVIPSKNIQTANQKKAKSNQKNVAVASSGGDLRVPLEDQANNQKSEITKTVKGKENKAEVIPSKKLLTANEKKSKSIQKNVAVASSRDDLRISLEDQPNNQKSEITIALNDKEHEAEVIPSKNQQTASQKKATSIQKSVSIASSTGVLRIESEVNISPSRPASMKQYRRTPYKSRRESEIFYSDDEICLKSPAVKRSRTSFKTPDKGSTPEFYDLCTSTSDSGGSFQCVTMRRPLNIYRSRSLIMSTTDSGTPGSTDGSKGKATGVSGSSGTRKSLRRSTKNRRSSSIKSTSKSPASRKSQMKQLQKSSPPAEIAATDTDESEAKAKSVTTPEAKTVRLSSSTVETPDQKGSAPSAVYVSPFVTISRGKNSARKEYHVRSSTGGTLPGAEAATSPKAGAQYFHELLNGEIERIEGICDEWNEYKNTNIPEEAHDMIDSAIGLSKLLIAQKFNQFRGLINQCQIGGEERTVSCQDLHGFWDMVYLQVEDLNKRFDNLNKLKENNWREIITEKKVVRTKRQRKTKTEASSKIKEMIDAAKKKKKQEQQGRTINDLPVILAEGVKVDESQPILQSPRPSPRRSVTKPGSSVRRSLRASLLTNQLQQKRRNSSPGLVMMNVSQMIKSNDGLTPCRSILKNTQQSKSEKRITKTVLFKEDLEEERFGHY